MQDGHASSIPSRPLREIARELSVERDNVKISQLVGELNCAFDEQTGTNPLTDGHACSPKPTDDL
jgi:hypothetical protein